MSRLEQVKLHKALRQDRIRSTVVGTSDRPRLSVFISNRHVYAQIIDDSKQKTLLSAGSLKNSSAKGNLSEIATIVGSEIAAKAKIAKIKKVVFDRSGRLYHGRVKALADAARAGGLEF